MNALLAAVPNPGTGYRPGFKFVMKILAGPDAGAQYQLAPPQVTLGRDAEQNHIHLNDPTVSRTAAVIDFTPQEITITDLSGRSQVSVNGTAGLRTTLKGGDEIAIGDTRLVFQVEIVPVALPGQLGQARPTAHGRPSAPQSRIQGAKQQPQPLFYILIVGLIGGAFYIATDNPLAQKAAVKLRRETQLETAIQDAESRTQTEEKARQFRTEEERTRYEEAQRHFIEGFRDYQKGIYARSVLSFQVALGIDNEHVQARRYLKLAEKNRDEMIAQLMDEGRKYREKGMYHRCAAAFEKAMILIPRNTDLKFKESDVLRRECLIKAAGRGGPQ